MELFMLFLIASGLALFKLFLRRPILPWSEMIRMS